MAEDVEVGSIIRPTQNLLSDMAEDVEVVGDGDGGNDEMVKRSSLSKKPNIFIEYLTSQHSGKICVFLDSFWLWLRFSVKSII